MQIYKINKTEMFKKISIKIPNLFEMINRYFKHVPKLQTRIKKGVDPKSIVTKADTDIQSIFESWVSNNFDNHKIFSEEKENDLTKSEWVWYIDPIDGTTLFSRDIEEWGVIICLTYNEDPVMSWVYFPYSETVFYAEKGLGAYKNDKKILTSKTREISKAIISGVYLNSLDREEIMVGKLWKKSLWGIIGRSLAKDFSDLAEGRIDIAVCFECYSWEYKALALLVEEAGGLCFGFSKTKFKVLETKPQNLLAFSNKHLVQEGIKLVKTPPALK